MEVERLKPKDAPLVELMKDSKLVETDAPEWYEDDLAPVHFGVYTIIGHDVDEHGVHTMMIRDNVRGLDITLRSIN